MFEDGLQIIYVDFMNAKESVGFIYSISAYKGLKKSQTQNGAGKENAPGRTKLTNWFMLKILLRGL